jgi:hypothetical protein
MGWDTKEIQTVCGEKTNQFKLGTCSVKWPYIIACMITGLVLLLSYLAILLAARQAQFILKYGSAYRNINRQGKKEYRIDKKTY